jgi:RNA polymerase sigma factor (sigma-70 family)
MTPLLAQRPRMDRSFERLYHRHVADVYHYALAVLRNPSDAEDVTQTTFLNAYRAYQRGERPSAAKNWLIAIAHNVCRQRFRQSSRRPQEVAFDDDVANAVADDDAPSAEDIRRALGHLAFNQRAALVMRELEGRTYAEIGEILDLSVSAVETLIFRARRALREQLEGSLSCGDAELAISRQVDGRLPRGERGPLRAHLRQCPECATFARSQRAQRAAFKTLGAAPLPASLSSLTSLFGGGGGAAVGTTIAAKAAAVLAAGALVGGAGYEGVKHARVLGGSGSPRSASAAPVSKASPATPHSAASSEEVAQTGPFRPAGRASSPKRKHAPPAKARGKGVSGGASRAHAGGVAASGRGNSAQATSSAGAAKSARPAGLGTPTRTRARGAPTRSGSNGQGRRARGTSPASSRGNGNASSKRTAKAHATAAPKPIAPSPPGQADKLPGAPKPPKADSEAATVATPAPAEPRKPK